MIVACLLHVSSVSEKQIESRVVNAQTGNGIPYVNIKVKGKTLGTSADVVGNFSLSGLEGDEELLFSAVGYSHKTLKVDMVSEKVELEPIVVALKEVAIEKKHVHREMSIGEVHKKLPSGYGCGGSPRIAARLFKPDTAYKRTPYIKQVKVLTRSRIKEAKFNIRLYKVNEEGEPGDYLYTENIIGLAKKGTQITEVDLSNLSIVFPEEGLFVAFEWLMIEENQREYNYTTSESRDKQRGVTTYPSIGAEWVDSNDLTRLNGSGTWMKGGLMIRGKYLEPSFELVLGN